MLVSHDNIFVKNDFFKKYLLSESVSNLKVYESPSEFLKDFGPKIEYITNATLMKLVDPKIIEEELKKDIKALPSYVSSYYHDIKDNDIPDLQSLEIENIAIENFYVVKDYSNDQLKVNISLRVKIKAIFQPENNIQELEAFLSKPFQGVWQQYTNSFDAERRLIFDHNILFIFEGDIDKQKETVSPLKFIDFIPDYFILHETFINQGPAGRNTCVHEFDKASGYWRNSRYGGGLSWHVRCLKCGQEGDTGEFYD